ncbi:MAG: polyprenyl synthetase family protein [Candidatus Eremiobacteraeota bacterium]|nr:polyprenyl synthetase family protein [Candidatus Eremiobacteraeota bacterium]
MTLATGRLPLSDHRTRVLEYLRGIALPFTSVAGTIVAEYLSTAPERDLLRPSLVLWAADACGAPERDALPVAAAFALFDRFMELHDELVEPPEQAGSVARWGLGQSLNAGDALYALALRALAEDVVNADRRIAVASLVARAVLEAIEGRTIDVERQARGARNGLLAQVRSVRRRSAVLTGAALQAGAILGGAPENVVRGFDRAGRLLDAASAVPRSDATLAARIALKATAAVGRCVSKKDALDRFEEAVRFVAAADH